MLKEFDFNLVIKRESYDFQNGVNPETIKQRLQALTEYYEWLHKEGGWTARRHLFLSEELVGAIEKQLQQEISYCKFYLEIQEKMPKPNFNKWIFAKKGEPGYEDDWQKPNCEQWVKTNGRIKAIVEIDRSGKMTEIRVQFKNDSGTLTFIDYYSHPKIKPSHVKSPESITERIKEYKQYADKFLKEHMFEQYNEEARSFNLLKKILCIGE